MSRTITKRKLTKMPLDVAEFLTKTKDMSSCVAGAYIRALCHYWMGECAGLPDDDAYLKNLLKVTDEEWPEVKSVLFQK